MVELGFISEVGRVYSCMFDCGSLSTFGGEIGIVKSLLKGLAMFLLVVYMEIVVEFDGTV